MMRHEAGRRFDTDAIALANPIEDVIAREVPLKRSGREFVGLCPFHAERTPSFQVIPAIADKSGKGFFHCKGCGAGGDQFDFVKRLYKRDAPGRLRNPRGHPGRASADGRPQDA